MADKLMRAQVIFPSASGDPEDVITNTWHFDGDDVVGASDVDHHTAVMTLLNGFYTAIDGVVLSSLATDPTVRIYDLRDPSLPGAPRIPEFTGSLDLTFSADSTDRLPTQVAACLSMKASISSGDNPRRRRGRIFLGPLVSDAFVTVSGRVLLSDAAITAIANAAGTLVDGTPIASGTGSVKWAIYSPTTDETGTIDDAFHDVVGGWVDNSPDIIRARKQSSTNRVTFS